MHPVDRFDSEGWFSSDQVIFLAVSCFLVKKHATLMLHAINVDSRTLELDNIDEWAKANNLTLNRSKSAEIVITDRKRKYHDIQPSSLPDICRVSAIKILGVTISN